MLSLPVNETLSPEAALHIATPATSPQVSGPLQRPPSESATSSPVLPLASPETPDLAVPTPMEQSSLPAMAELDHARTGDIMQDELCTRALASPMSSLSSLSESPVPEDVMDEHEESSVLQSMSLPRLTHQHSMPDSIDKGPDTIDDSTFLSAQTPAPSRQESTLMPSRCAMLRGLKPGTSLMYIARLLRRSLVPGDQSPYGCGVQISGSSGPLGDGSSLVIECYDTRSSRIVEAAWDNSDMDGRTISVKQMTVSDLEGISIYPYHTISYPPYTSLIPNDAKSGGGGDHTALADDREGPSRSYQPYRRAWRMQRATS
jgi:hypothetical protein